MSKPLPKKIRKKWDGLIATEGAAMGLSKCEVFLENKLINDVFYKGFYNGKPCVVKCSSRDPDSIRNEYETLRKVYSVNPNVFPEPLAFRPGKMAFVVMELVDGAHAENPARDILEIADVLQKTGVVHRDVSPLNLLTGRDGRIKLIDFQFAIDRHRYYETRFMRRHPKYLYVHFGNCEQMGLGVWNDLMGYGLLFCLKQMAPGAKDAISALGAKVESFTFAAPIAFRSRVSVCLYLLSLHIQNMFVTKQSVVWRLGKIKKLLRRN